jgi:hypothetical protein
MLEGKDSSNGQTNNRSRKNPDVNFAHITARPPLCLID